MSTYRKGELRIHETKLMVWEDECDQEHFYSPGMLQVFGSALGRLKARGFSVEKDPHIEKNYKSLSRGNRVGTRNGLHFHARLSGRCLEFEFFVDGERGVYDFNKYWRMPRSVQIECIAIIASLVESLLTYGYRLERDLKADILSIRDAVERRRYDALTEFNRTWTSHRFERDETGWPSAKEARNERRTDLDGKPLVNGAWKYTRVRGRLVFGQVYYAINSNWVLVSNGSGHYVHDPKALFDYDDPAGGPRRYFDHAFVTRRLEGLLADATKKKAWRDVERFAHALSSTTQLGGRR